MRQNICTAQQLWVDSARSCFFWQTYIWLCFNSKVYFQKCKLLVFDVTHVDMILKLVDSKWACKHLDVLFFWLKIFKPSRASSKQLKVMIQYVMCEFKHHLLLHGVFHMSRSCSSQMVAISHRLPSDIAGLSQCKGTFHSVVKGSTDAGDILYSMLH